MVNGRDCEARDAAVGSVDWNDAQSNCEWRWANLGYLKGLKGFDTITDAVGCVKQWREAAKVDKFNRFKDRLSVFYIPLLSQTKKHFFFSYLFILVYPSSQRQRPKKKKSIQKERNLVPQRPSNLNVGEQQSLLSSKSHLTDFNAIKQYHVL